MSRGSFLRVLRTSLTISVYHLFASSSVILCHTLHMWIHSSGYDPLSVWQTLFWTRNMVVLAIKARVPHVSGVVYITYTYIIRIYIYIHLHHCIIRDIHTYTKNRFTFI